MPRGDGTGPAGQGSGTGRVWVEAPDGAEAEWVVHLPQGWAVAVSVRTAAIRPLMLRDSLATQKAVLNVVQK